MKDITEYFPKNPIVRLVKREGEPATLEAAAFKSADSCKEEDYKTWVSPMPDTWLRWIFELAADGVKYRLTPEGQREAREQEAASRRESARKSSPAIEEPSPPSAKAVSAKTKSPGGSRKKAKRSKGGKKRKKMPPRIPSSPGTTP